MAPNQAVLVSSPDEDVVSTLAATLRDRWPVRTAATAAETETSLDESTAVVIFDPALESLSRSALTALIDERSPHAQVIRLGTDSAADDDADADLAYDAGERTVYSTVDRFQTRAEYDRLLSRFYSLARSRGEQVTDETSSETGDEFATDLRELKRKLDEIAAELDDDDAFEVALRD